MAKNNNNGQPMVNKVVYEEDKNTGGIFASMVFMFLVLIVFVIGIVFTILYLLPPRLDTSMITPVITSLPTQSNKQTLMVEGTAEDVKKVIVYVNDKEVKKVNVTENKFSYEYPVTNEADYKFEVAGLKGFPIRYRSSKSAVSLVKIDWTLPSKTVTYKMEKTSDTKTTTVTGVAEANSIVTISKDGKTYTAQADDKGNFTIKGVDLTKGNNSFRVEVSDKAGNKVTLDSNLVLVYNTGSINGGGAQELPESAGVLSDAMSYLFGSRLMSILGLIALGVLVINSTVVFAKIRKNSF